MYSILLLNKYILKAFISSLLSLVIINFKFSGNVNNLFSIIYVKNLFICISYFLHANITWFNFPTVWSSPVKNGWSITLILLHRYSEVLACSSVNCRKRSCCYVIMKPCFGSQLRKHFNISLQFCRLSKLFLPSSSYFCLSIIFEFVRVKFDIYVFCIYKIFCSVVYYLIFFSCLNSTILMLTWLVLSSIWSGKAFNCVLYISKLFWIFIFLIKHLSANKRILYFKGGFQHSTKTVLLEVDFRAPNKILRIFSIDVSNFLSCESWSAPYNIRP